MKKFVADLECFGLVVEILLSRCRAIDSIHVQNSPVQCWHFHHRKNWKPGEIMAMPICHTLISNAGMKSTASNFGADTRVLKKSKRSRKVEPFRKFQEYKVMVTPTFFTTHAKCPTLSLIGFSLRLVIRLPKLNSAVETGRPDIAGHPARAQ